MKKISLALALTGIAAITLFVFNNCSQMSPNPAADNSGMAESTSIPLSSPLPVVGSESNVMPITVGCGYVNEPCVTVTVCNPGTNTCVSIPDVLIDTGSSGLRIFSSVVTSLSLPSEIDPTSHNPIAECQSYADGSSDWGPVVTADVLLGNGNERASGVPIQIINSSYSQIPSNCSDPDTDPSTVGFNGILGVSFFQQDCGDGCDGTNTDNQIYFNCTSTACNPIAVSDSMQVPNPVYSLPQDNNGVIVQFPAISNGGTSLASGYAILGIGTQSDNTPPSGVTVFQADSFGNFETQYGGNTFSESFIDSGSNGLYFPDSTIPQCGSSDAGDGFYCPSSTLSLSAVQASAIGGSQDQIGFPVMNGDAAMDPSNPAMVFNDLAGPATGFFDWGLPFFFGKTVYVGNQGVSTPLGMGPFWGI